MIELFYEKALGNYRKYYRLLSNKKKCLDFEDKSPLNISRFRRDVDNIIVDVIFLFGKS